MRIAGTKDAQLSEGLLDAGCGPGVLELPLARLFDQVTALDPEPGMLQVGQRRCQQAGVTNVRWVQGVAEDIAALNLGSLRAVTFGQSFHRVRRLEVAEAVYDLLVPGRSLILISHNADDGRPRPAGPGHPEVPRAAVRKLILDYLGDGTRRYLATWNEGQPARFEDFSLAAPLRELAILQVGRLDQRYEWDQHVPIARHIGVTDEQIAALERGDDSGPFDPTQRAVLCFVADMVRDGQVADDDYAVLSGLLSEQEIVKVAFVTAQYLGLARMMTALRIDPEDPIGRQGLAATSEAIAASA